MPLCVSSTSSKKIEVSALVRQWCTADLEAIETVSAILAKHGLDEAAIEAEAFTLCAPVACDCQLLTSHMLRRDKALPSLAFFRDMKAQLSRVAIASPEIAQRS
jgi:hypothetical protein